jgi:hypothetical protein
MEQWWSDNWQGKIKVFREKFAPAPLCAPQMAYGCPWGLNQISVMRNGDRLRYVMAII